MDILTNKERDYLLDIINPFKENVKSIEKQGNYLKDEERIVIFTDSVMYLPYFKKGSMYKGMKFDKSYTLDELGL